MADVFTPYITGASMFGAKPAWIPDELDQQRILSYQLYEEIYWNVPDVFKVSLRGSNELPIYVPSGRTIIEATNRYVAPKFAVNLAPSTESATDLTPMRLVMRDLLARERFRSKFNGAKRYGLIRGDWIWHITADPAKPEGSRISIVALDPGMYFPITDEDNVDKIIGCHLVELITTEEGPRVRRQTYRKVPRADGTAQITVEDGIFKTDGWENAEFKPEKVLRAPTALPDQITALPVYHVRNFDEPGNPFGSSELRGLERVMGAINQVLSDEDLALALDGIGVYATDAPHPRDPVTGVLTAWQLGPGRVAHHPQGTAFNRLNGVGSVAPYGDHFERLRGALREAASTPDIAVGAVDVAVASSGIALALQLSPMLSKAGEKNDLIVDTHNQMFFDLMRGWYPAYEDDVFGDASPDCGIGDAVPVDRAAKLAELRQLKEDGVIDGEYYRDELRKIGYEFPDGFAERVKQEQDAVGARADAELDQPDGEE